MFATYLTIGLTIYVILLFIIYFQSKDYKINSLWLLFLSIILTPIVGFIILFFTDKKNILDIVYYKCPSCKMQYTEWNDCCPSCQKNGENISLRAIRFKSV